MFDLSIFSFKTAISEIQKSYPLYINNLTYKLIIPSISANTGQYGISKEIEANLRFKIKPTEVRSHLKDAWFIEFSYNNDVKQNICGIFCGTYMCFI